MKRKVIIGIIIAIVAVLVIAGGVKRGWFTGAAGASPYSAVFLDNNQVYFGKLSVGAGAFVTLRDIFYLQVNPSAQQPINTSRDISLVKLGNELHGPTDEMSINRSHILITEPLRQDSQVVQAIERYKKQQSGQ